MFRVVMEPSTHFKKVSSWLSQAVRMSFRPSIRYAGALGTVAAGLGLTIFFHSDAGKMAVAFNLFAVVIASLFGGLGPGILASLISALGIDYYFLEPIGRVDARSITHTAIFTLISVLVSLLVSSLKASMKNAEMLREAAEKANREKDMVLAFLSHDLRNPLSSILLTLQLIKRRRARVIGDDKADELAAQAEAACRRMNRMIEDLLVSSKIEAGGIRIDPKPTDLHAIIQGVVSEHEVLARARGLSFFIEGDASIPITADETLLSQVLANLIGNALKFTPEGGVVCVESFVTPEEIVLKVIDTGQGIAAEDLPKVFNKFWQQEKKSKSGAGLGMFLTRAIVEAHGGKIKVTSERGRGTVFAVTFPISLMRDPGAQLRSVSLS